MARVLREKAVQKAVYQLLMNCGCAVYWMSQARETRQTKGVPDLIVFSQLRGLAFVECKAPNGRPSSAQMVFRGLCEREGIPYILAQSVEPVRDWLGAKR